MNVPAIASAVAFVIYLVLAILVYRQGVKPRSRRLFFIYMVIMLAWQGAAVLVSLTESKEVAYTVYKWMTVLGSVHFLVYYLFVREFLNVTIHRRLATVAYAGLVLVPLVTIFSGDFVIAEIYADSATGLLVPNFGLLTYPLGAFTYAFLGLAAFYLYRAVRDARTSIERNRLRYMYVGAVLVMLGTLANFLPTLRAYPVDIVANIINAILIFYIVLRYQLLDFKIVIRRGLIYSLPTAVISAGYMLTVFLAANVFRSVTGYQVVLAYIAVAVTIAVVFHPLYIRMQDWVDRLFFREKYDANLMVQRLSRSVSTVLNIDQLANMILDDVVETMHVTQAALLLQEADAGYFAPIAVRGYEGTTQLELNADNPIVRTLAEHNEILTRYDLDVLPQFKALLVQERADLQDMNVELFVPLAGRDELVGILALAPKRSGIAYTKDEQSTLLTVANQAVVAVQNANLYQTALDEKERAEVILEHAFAGIIVVDRSQTIVKANPGAETITGFSTGELEGAPLCDILDCDFLLGYDLSADETALPVVQVMQLTTANGARRDVLLGTTPITDGFLLNFADITHLKEVDRLKSNIVTSVSHELRTPLASIMGYSELILEGLHGGDEALTRQFIGIINDEAGRLNRLINDLLDLSRLEAGRIEPNMAVCDVEGIIRRSLRTMNIQIQEANVRVSVDIPENLQPLWADSSMMTIIFKNLLDNAIKFSLEGGQITVRVSQHADALQIEVKDDGEGIPQEELPELFTKFYRSPSVQRAGIKGTGLGLALAKEATEMHGGSIRVESEPGVGSTFIVTIPMNTYEPESELVFVGE
ncbi:MAG: GAF domain-containing protein [Caldilineales bacterium]|nr:GAF domain-containing protein [Caldilineales bacterium]